MSQPSVTQGTPPQPPHGTPNNQGPARPTLTRQRRKSSGGDLFWFACKTLGLIFFIIVVVSVYDAFRAPAGPGPLPENGSAGTKAEELPEDLEQRIEIETALSVQRQQLDAAKFKQRQLIATYAEVTRALDEWEKELSSWEKMGLPLLKSDEGKKIASEPALVKRFRVVIDQDRPMREVLTAARKQAEELITPIREAERNAEDASAPDEQLAQSLRELQTQARKARDSYRDARGVVEGLLAQASTPAAQTLEQAIDAQSQEEALARAAVIEAEEKKAKDEGARLIAEERAKLARLESDMEVGRIRDQAEQKRQGLLITGSKWKGTLVIGNVTSPTQIVIGRRVKDQIEGTVSWYWNRGQSAWIVLSFSGTVQGTTIKFKTLQVLHEDGSGFARPGTTYNAVYDPVAGTIIGTLGQEGQVSGTYTYRLATEDEEE
jgi:hypothetical protein